MRWNTCPGGLFLLLLQKFQPQLCHCGILGLGKSKFNNERKEPYVRCSISSYGLGMELSSSKSTRILYHFETTSGRKVPVMRFATSRWDFPQASDRRRFRSRNTPNWQLSDWPMRTGCLRTHGDLRPFANFPRSSGRQECPSESLDRSPASKLPWGW